MKVEECEKEKMELIEAKKELVKMREVVDQQNEIITGVIENISNLIEVATEKPVEGKKEIIKILKDLN